MAGKIITLNKDEVTKVVELARGYLMTFEINYICHSLFKGIENVKNGKYFYSMSYDGIEAFINDFKQHNHVIDEDIDLVKEKQLTALKYTKRYVLCHLPTNTYYYENSNGYGKGMREMLYQKYNVMGERLCNFLAWNFMFNGNYCKATFDVTNILDDGTITDLKIEYSTNEVIKNVEAVFNSEKGCLNLLTTVFIPFSDKKGNIDEFKNRKLVYIHLTKNNTSLLNTFLKGREEYYNR